MRRLHWLRLAALCLAMTIGAPAAAQSPDETRTKEAAVRELMTLTGAADMGRQVMEQMLPPLKKAIPNAPEAFWEGFMAEVKTEELVDLVVPVYLKYFTQDDIEQLIVFYKTPLGRKLISSMSPVTRECMAAGQQWGRAVAERAMKKLDGNSPPKS